ncbi:unnamed protein product [Malus baccata var. baccata]
MEKNWKFHGWSLPSRRYKSPEIPFDIRAQWTSWSRHSFPLIRFSYKISQFLFQSPDQTTHKIAGFHRTQNSPAEAEMSKVEEPAMGVPVYTVQNPYQAGMIPPNAVYGDPKGVPIQQTIYRDTPAPFNCAYCGDTGLTKVKSKPSAAAVVACMMPMMLGCCFLLPSCDCLWHKYHYCPNCQEKVADFEKSDPCLVADPSSWTERSYALPA